MKNEIKYEDLASVNLIRDRYPNIKIEYIVDNERSIANKIEFTGARTDKYEIKINDSKTITMHNDKYSACDAVKICLSQFNDDYDIYCSSDTVKNLPINRNDHEKASWIIAMIGINIDMGKHFQFKQDDKIVTLKRVFKT